MTLDKSTLRARLKLTLKELKTSGDLEKKNELLVSNIESLFNFHLKITQPNHYIVGAYAPLDLEPNWLPFLESDLGSKISWSFPRLKKEGEMEFCLSEFSELEVRKDFGVEVKVPKKSAKSCTPNLLVIPGMGFSERGERMGKGKGFYDKYLHAFKGVTVGLCFEEQIVQDLPTEDHDKKVEFLVTDKRVLICKKS